MKLWDKFESVEELIGKDELLLNIAKGISSDELNYLLNSLIKDYDLENEFEEDYEWYTN